MAERAPGGKWDSPARLEFIAKTYAKEHKIDFDFAHTERHVYIEKRGTNTFATIAFYQGMGKLAFEADIDRGGKVLRHAVTKVIEGPRRDQP